MKRLADREVRIFLKDAERRQACLESSSEQLHRLLEARVKTGLLVSPLPQLYARTELWDQLDQTMRTAHLARGLQELHPSWVFCGTTAAVMHGLDVSWHIQDPLEISSRSGRAKTASPHVVRRYVSGDEPVEMNGVRVATLSRTLLDCMRRLEFREALAVVDSALHQGLIDSERLLSYVSGGRRGMAGMERVRNIAQMADPRPENGMESIARALMYELGFVAPELQVPFSDPMNPRKTYYVDYCWTLSDGSLVIGELDGGEKYRNPLMNGGSPEAKMRKERRRESRISIGRPAIVRFSPEEVRDVSYFNQLLETFGVPKDHEPIIDIPAGPVSETVPLGAYGLE